MITDLQSSETSKELQALRLQLRQNREAKKKARQRIMNGGLTELPAGQQEAINAADEKLLEAKAAHRLGFGSEEDVQAAEQALQQLTSSLEERKQEAAEEHALLNAQEALLKNRISAAEAKLLSETAEVMRPAAKKWLEALAAFIAANDELHEVELAVTEAGGTPPVHAARDMHLTATSSKSRVPRMLTGPQN